MSNNNSRGVATTLSQLVSVKKLIWATGIFVILGGVFLSLLIVIGLFAALGGSDNKSTDTNNASGIGLSDAVPEQYREVVLRAGSICAIVTPPVIAAQIEAESNWQTDIVSEAGAQGISQFMPGTWATHGLDGDGDGRADITNPIDAIWSQGNYMCSLNSEIKTHLASGAIAGDELSLTLAAYNAGLGNVLLYKGVPLFIETRMYIDKILANIPKYTGNTTGTQTVIPGNIGSALAWAKSIAADPGNYYAWGGEGPRGWDCSGLAKGFMARLGVTLPRTADQQSRTGKPVSASAAQAGDLIFWADQSGFVFHVAIYAGNGWMVSADSVASGINFRPVDFMGSRLFYKTYLR